MSWKVEVIADDSGKWVANSVRFATDVEAQAYARDLSLRWTLVRQSRVVESGEPVTDVIVDGMRYPVGEAP